MPHPEKIEQPQSKIEKDNKERKLLDPEISRFLTEIRETDLPFHEKAKQLEDFLRQKHCKNVVRFDCDVCIKEYLPSGKAYIDVVQEVLGDKKYDDLLEEEKDALIEKVDKLLPEEGKTRVQAETPIGYFTYCFDCDGTMCMNEVEYPDDPNWDEKYLIEAEKFLLEHPELEIESFTLFGSTRRYINVDALTENPEKEGQFLTFSLSDGRKIFINYSSRETIYLLREEEGKKIIEHYRKLHK